MRLEISGVTVLRQDDDLINGSRLDDPKTGSVDEYAFDVHGWANAQLGQIELAAVRGYDGWAGHNAFGFPLHGFKVSLDPWDFSS